MTDHITLAEALRRAGTQLDQELPPPGLAAAVRSALHQQPESQAQGRAQDRKSIGAGTRWPMQPRTWPWPGAATGAVFASVLAVSVLLMLQGPATPPPAPEQRMGGFVPVVPLERWPAEDAPAWLVRTELQRDRMAALGLPFDPTRAAESVRAELLVRASGEVLAVRFVE